MNTLREAIAFTGQVTNLNSIMVAVTDAINRGATKILFDKAKPYILLQRPIKEGEEETTDEQDVYRTVRQNEILEIQVDDSKNAYTGFFDIFKTINDKKLFVNYILVNNKSKIKKWLGLNSIDVIFNAKVLESDEVEEDVILFCGSESKLPDPFDVKFTVKGYIPC